MGDADERSTARAQLAASGMSVDDLDWLDAIGWSDAAIPPPTPAEVAFYQRREAALNASIADLSITERGASLQGRLAAAIGARLADLRDREDED